MYFKHTRLHRYPSLYSPNLSWSIQPKHDTMLQTRYNSIKAYLASGTVPSSLPSTVSNFRREASKYRLEPNGELSREGKRVALYKDRMKIFNALHQHAGRDCSWKKIKARYYWRGGQTFVAKKVSQCVACAYKNNQLWKASLPKLKAISVKPKAFWRGITYWKQNIEGILSSYRLHGSAYSNLKWKQSCGLGCLRANKIRRSCR